MLVGALIAYFAVLHTCKKAWRFHEVEWDRRVIARQILANALNRLPPAVDTNTTTWKKLPDSNKRPALELLRTRGILDSLHRKTSRPGNATLDTFLSQSLFIAGHDTAIRSLNYRAGELIPSWPWNTRYKRTGRTFNVSLEHDALPDSLRTAPYTPTVSTYPVATFFFDRHPSLALWVVLLFITLCCYGAVLPWLLYLVYGPPTRALLETGGIADKRQKILITFSAGVVVLISVVFITLVSDDSVMLIPPALFMQSRGAAFGPANLIGYITAGVCFVGFMVCAVVVGPLRKKMQETTDPVELEKLKSAAGDLGALFNNLFLILSLQLTGAVFTTGVYFHGLNSLAFVRQVSGQLGTPALSYNWVLLYGLVHSFIILAFYLPLRTMLSFTSRTADAKTAAMEDTAGAKATVPNIFLTPMRQLLEGLVAVSPLLAGLLQALLKGIFGE